MNGLATLDDQIKSHYRLLLNNINFSLKINLREGLLKKEEIPSFLINQLNIVNSIMVDRYGLDLVKNILKNGEK